MSRQRLRPWQQALVWAWAALSLVAIYRRGEHAEIDRHVTNRLRFHAIPMAISVLDHGRPHDYTAFSSIAIAFQDTTPDIDAKIAHAVSQTPPVDDPTYYWVADDRGMGDYVIAAFALFGPRTRSLYHFYFVVLGASVMLFLADLGWHPGASALLIFALGGLYTCTLVIPLGNLTLTNFEPGSLFEPRIIELLSFVATLHLALAPFFSDRWTPIRRTIVAGQAAIFVACYHARSSVGWQLAFVLAFGIAYWLWRRQTVGGVARSPGLTALNAGWPVLCLVLGLGMLKVYQHASYNPRYFRDMGTRTVWHNALMGLWWNQHLAEKYQLRVHDNTIVAAVRSYLRTTHDPRLTAEWTDSNILGALAGHSVFNWFTYEDAARDFYWHIWLSDTGAAVHCYVIDKPRAILRVLVKAMNPSPSLLRDVHDLGFRPLAPTALLLVLPGLLLVCAGDIGFAGMVGALLLLFACSVVPGFLFYPVVHTMMGAFTTLTVLVYLVLAQGTSVAIGSVRRRLAVPGGGIRAGALS